MRRASFAVLFLILFGLSAAAQTTIPGSTGAPSPMLNGMGAPAYTCNSDLLNIAYVQTDAKTGRLWLCDMSSGVPAWDHLIAPIAAATTGTITTGALLLGGCSAIAKVAVPQAVLGTNAVTASPIYSVVPSNPGLLNVTAWVDSNGSVSVQACALGTLSTTTFTARVLLY